MAVAATGSVSGVMQGLAQIDSQSFSLEEGEVGTSGGSGCQVCVRSSLQLGMSKSISTGNRAEARGLRQGQNGANRGILGIPAALQEILGRLTVERGTGPLEPAPDTEGVMGAFQLLDQQGQRVQPCCHSIGAGAFPQQAEVKARSAVRASAPG